MKIRFLFPNGWKPVGWVLLIVGLILGVFTLFSGWQPAFLDITVINILHDGIFPFEDKEHGWFAAIENNVADEIAAIMIIIGGLLVSFSKVKVEDEYIAKIRQESLVWAFYLHYALLILSILFLYELTFYFVMVFTMFTPLIIFLVRFHIALYNLRKTEVS